MTQSGAGSTEGAGPTEPEQNRSGPPSIGPLAVEAALLLDVVADRLTSLRPAAEPDTGWAGESPSGPPPAPPSDPPPAPPSGPPPAPPSGPPPAPPSGPPPAPPSDPPPATPSDPPTAPRTAPTRSEPSLGPDGRCPECGSLPGASCTACPLCRFLAVLRGERPEATAKLVDGALLIVRTLRSLLPEVEPAAAASGGGTAGGSAEHRPPGPPGPSGPSARRPGGLEHIDIR